MPLTGTKIENSGAVVECNAEGNIVIAPAPGKVVQCPDFQTLSIAGGGRVGVNELGGAFVNGGNGGQIYCTPGAAIRYSCRMPADEELEPETFAFYLSTNELRVKAKTGDGIIHDALVASL